MAWQHAASRETVQLREHSPTWRRPSTLLGVLDDVDTTVARRCGGGVVARSRTRTRRTRRASGAQRDGRRSRADARSSRAIAPTRCRPPSSRRRTRRWRRPARKRPRRTARIRGTCATRVARRLRAKERGWRPPQRRGDAKLLEKKDVEARGRHGTQEDLHAACGSGLAARRRRGGGDPVADAHDGGGPARAPARPDGGAARLCHSLLSVPRRRATERAAMPGVKMSVNEWRTRRRRRRPPRCAPRTGCSSACPRARRGAQDRREGAGRRQSRTPRCRPARRHRRPPPTSADATPSPTDAPSPASARQPRETRESDVVASPGAVAQALPRVARRREGPRSERAIGGI